MTRREEKRRQEKKLLLWDENIEVEVGVLARLCYRQIVDARLSIYLPEHYLCDE